MLKLHVTCFDVDDTHHKQIHWVIIISDFTTFKAPWCILQAGIGCDESGD